MNNKVPSAIVSKIYIKKNIYIYIYKCTQEITPPLELKYQQTDIIQYPQQVPGVVKHSLTGSYSCFPFLKFNILSFSGVALKALFNSERFPGDKS